MEEWVCSFGILYFFELLIIGMHFRFLAPYIFGARDYGIAFSLFVTPYFQNSHLWDSIITFCYPIFSAPLIIRMHFSFLLPYIFSAPDYRDAFTQCSIVRQLT